MELIGKQVMFYNMLSGAMLRRGWMLEDFVARATNADGSWIWTKFIS